MHNNNPFEEPEFDDDALSPDDIAELSAIDDVPVDLNARRLQKKADPEPPEPKPADDAVDNPFELDDDDQARVDKAAAADADAKEADQYEREVEVQLRRLQAQREAKRRFAELPPPDEPDRGSVEWLARVKERFPRQDLTALLSEPLPPVQWLEDGFIAQGDYVAITSDAKAGKSLLAYDCAINWSLGKSALTSNPIDPPTMEPVRTLYLDAENGPRWQHNKITAFGVVGSPFADHLDIVNFPALPPLDTPEGGQQLLAMIDTYLPDVLVLDTVSRFVEGNENDASTWLALYRNSIMPIRAKYPNLTIVRLDHFGKDKERGSRGSSAKMSDIDVHFVITAAPKDRNVLTLKCERSRNQHYAEELVIERKDGPLRHEQPTGMARKAALAAAAKPTDDERVRDAVAIFDLLDIPTKLGYRKAAEVARKQGYKVGHEYALDAQKVRRDRTGEE